MALHNKARNDHKPTDKRNISLAGKFIDIFVAPIYVGGRDEDFIGSALLIQDQTEAKVLERSRDEFFSIASHELRTPLTAIRGNTSLIQEHYSDKLDPELKEMVNDIHDSSIRLIDIVNDFLNMGRLEQQRIDFKNESFVIEDLIAAALKEYEVTGSRQNLSLEFIAPPKPMPRVFADKDRIRQVLINLIGNSLKFTTMGGVKISVRENDGMVEVSIVDTGRGIALPNQALLFHKFQQAGDSLFTRDTTKGTGLGLYISKLMIEAMGGKIWLVRSEEGKGSEFAFTLPLAKAGAL
jgi:signal transduction histidine kinase